MNTQHKSLILPLVFALAMLAVFVLSTPVFAQDEVPPPEVAPTEVLTEAAPVPEVAPTEAPTEIIPTEEPVVETLVPDVAPTVETPVEDPPEALQPPAEEPAAADLAPVLEAVADAGVALADNSGEPIPMATEQAEAALSDTDPWFMVGSVKYSFTLADCNPDLAGDQPCLQPLQAAVNYISSTGKIPTDGFIHVDKTITPLANQKVEINGGDPNLAKLKGIVGPIVNPDTFTPDAYLSSDDGDSGSYIYVHDKPNGFTLSGLKIVGASANTDYWQGVVDLNNCSGALLLQDLIVIDEFSRANGITIRNHNGSVTLRNVDQVIILVGAEHLSIIQSGQPPQ